ncbi:MAG: isoleucine--tRNA ligase, partial [Oscillospiraceae bacterium]|nr:isoleucine--tRNA ligase [Oscillospiraceae bacterium]
MAQDYNSTLNLPQTDFSMRANLPEREPALYKKQEEEKLYYKIQEKNKRKPTYILHDGPPYANGDIHMGTALNKTLKDIIVKYKAMTGFLTPYIPGWDCHGLPIELRAIKELGIEKGTVETADLRKNCRNFALSCLDRQKTQFKRLGVWGDFDNPYLTIAPEYEAKQIEIFGEIYKKGFIYKGLKPVHWCADCKTALAEAEIEYADDACYSIYVKFPFSDDKGVCAKQGIDVSRAFVLIWTTTTWTLPGNLAISLGPDYDYTFIKTEENEYILVAKELAKQVTEACKIENYSLVGEFKGSDLELLETAHPFLPRKSIIITGGHVTLESGTGCVHTAPGHGADDFNVCKNYKELPIYVPVDFRGRMTSEAGKYEGLKTKDANGAIIEDLKASGALFASERMTHQYPHCWRCKAPILFRATEQWFCSIDGFKSEALEVVKNVSWYPAWGEERIANMIKDRSDWCISRQRIWGVPIPIFYCKECSHYEINEKYINKIAELFGKEGSNAWYKYTPEEIVGEKMICSKCGNDTWEKETNTMDGWFDSGTSYAYVLKDNPNQSFPSEIYFEGNDQFRGWFQSSLLTSIASRGAAPYKMVITNGWVVDGEGKAMSKSLGNVIDPIDVINEYGSDVLRLWVSSVDYTND